MYKRKTVDKYVLDAWRIALTTVAMVLVVVLLKKPQNEPKAIISPLVNKTCAKEIIYREKENIDTWIDKYAKKYSKSKTQESRLKYQLHCLAYFETKHNAFKTCGDSQKACGLYQYHLNTWISFRKIMIKKGLIDEIGDRFNVKQAIETTAWALSDGRINNWGPAKRGKCQ